LEIRAAAPLYADVPTLSRASLMATKDLASVSGLQARRVIKSPSTQEGEDSQLIFARFNRMRARSVDSRRQEFHMSLLVSSDLLETSASPLGETGVEEVLFTVLGEPLLVVRVLEVFESEGKVEDVDVCSR
jgi:hypothetical protein